MTRKKVWRYYCEFCGRAGCAGGHIAAHERSCTANPNRICGFCREARGEQKPIADLIAALTSCGSDLEAGVKALRDAAEACPACMLSAIRQSEMQRQTVTPAAGEWEYVHVPFDFKRECASFWADVNAVREDAHDSPY